MTSHPSGSTQAVVDMSIGSDSPVSSVSVYVGPERRQFIILGQVLNKKSIKWNLLFKRCGAFQQDYADLADELLKFRLDAVDPEAFNLFAQWLYGIELPRSSGALKPWVEKSEVSSAKSSFNHIAFHGPYRKFSAEEIRLADMLRFSAARTSTSSTTDAKSPPESHVSPREDMLSGALTNMTLQPRQEKATAESPNARQASQQNTTAKKDDTVPDNPLPAKPLTEAMDERTQTNLLKLMLLAEMAGWKQCFSDALDNYRHGEIHIKRETLNHDHIDLAYSTIAAARLMPNESITLQFMADYAYFTSLKHGHLTAYQQLFTKFPRFLNDTKLREEGRLFVPGVTRARRKDMTIVAAFLSHEESPLHTKEAQYRV
ncbi:hypothetical protein PG994_011873 [Apiospora phragmitis]|uniref:BTB domain-containing protein n=1 Tax=Apiospora phragmitis TaxID=2905665 RepID=A0ABR1TU49_9PEZI